jgi:hypothetical protein
MEEQESRQGDSKGILNKKKKKKTPDKEAESS